MRIAAKERKEGKKKEFKELLEFEEFKERTSASDDCPATSLMQNKPLNHPRAADELLP
jgi:hypothetical protein